MKLKGVNPLEQHIEKIVLAVVAGIFLIVLAAQFLLAPNQVRVGNAPPVPPARAFHEAKNRAESLREEMRRTDIELPPIPPVDLAEQFLARREAPVAPIATTAAWGQPLQLDIVPGTQVVTGTGSFLRPEVPAPAVPVGYSPRGTINPFEVQRTPELAAFIPPEQPFDIAAVSVETKFDGRKLRSRLLEAGGDGTQPIPASWWRDGIEILDTRLEREELTATGEWTNLTEVPRIPGRFSLDERLRQVRSTVDLADIIEDAAEMSAEIRRPRFLPMIAGAPWMPPAEAAKLRPQVRDAFIDGRLRDREPLRRRLEEAREEREKSEGDANARSQLDQRIRALERQIASIDAELARRGYTPPAPETEEDAPREQQVHRPLLENNAVQVWAHDLTVRPGQVYRYRLSVGINNPAFGRASALVEDQQDMASRPILWSEPSPWSEPVQVLDDKYFRIENANVADSLGGARVAARARAEVYQFAYGYYRRGTVTLESGDVVIATLSLPDRELLPIYDLTALSRRNGEADPENPVLTGTDTLPTENARPWDVTLVCTIDTYLLDVAPLPDGAGARPSVVAYFRDAEGGIQIRSPERDRQNEIFLWIAQSVQEGERQGAPEVEIEDPDPVPSPRPGRRDERDTTPPAGPGTGGG